MLGVMSAAHAGTSGRARGALVALAIAAVAFAGTGLPGSAADAAPAATSGPLRVAIVAPLTTEVPDAGLLDAERLAALTAPGGELTRTVEAIAGTGATIALDPLILASIRRLGSAAPESARAWLERLAALDEPVFLLAYADADLTPFARADRLDLAAPSDLEFGIDAAAFGPAPTQTPAPTPTEGGEDAAPPLPTTADLLAWDGALGRIAWPAEDTAIAADLAAYVAAGFDAALLSSRNVSETGGARAVAGDAAILVADSAASALARSASTAIDDATRGSALARLAAALDGLAAAHPGRSVVLTLDRAPGSVPFSLAETAASIAADGDARIVGLDDVVAEAPERASVVAGEDDPGVAALPALADADADLAAFSSILAEPTRLTGPARLELLALYSAPGVEAEDWPARAAAVLAGTQDTLGAVRIERKDVLVTSNSTVVPVRVSNALDLPVTVRVAAQPAAPLIRIESPAEVTIEPGSTETVRLDAQAITNGRVAVVVSLSSPTGVAIGTPSRLSVDLQAQWETVGLVIGAIVALVFALGIVRNILVRRRRARAASTDPVEADA